MHLWIGIELRSKVEKVKILSKDKDGGRFTLFVTIEGGSTTDLSFGMSQTSVIAVMTSGAGGLQEAL